MLYPFSFMLLDSPSPSQQEEETTTTTAEEPGDTTTTEEETTTTEAIPPPVNSEPPEITGIPTVGETLFLSSIGIWSGADSGYTVEWKDDYNSVIGTGDNILLELSQISRTITVFVTRSNAGGSTTAASGSIGPVVDATTTTTEEATTTTAEETTTTTMEETTTTTTEAPPAYGTPMGDPYCDGYNLMQAQADGMGGTFAAVIESNSPTCGF